MKGENVVKGVFLIVVLFVTAVLKGQTPDEELLEGLMESLPEEARGKDHTVWIEELRYYYQNPLNINTAKREELALLRILSDYQINQILNYRETYGRMYSIYEFKAIPGFSRTLARKIAPFIKFGAKETRSLKLQNVLKFGQNEVFLRSEATLEQPRGYRDSSGYRGNRLKHYLRYQYDYNRRVRWGLVAEKDPGEQFFRGAQKAGFDYYSAHLEIKDIGSVQQLVAGDFQGQFGQGLVLSSGFRNGKSPYVLNTSKQTDGLRKYSSTNENQFFRGAGVEIAFKGFEITAFASQKMRDANLDADTSGIFVTSLNATGIHGTAKQAEDKDVLRERVAGGQVKWLGKRLKVGASILAADFDIPVKPRGSGMQEYDFSGNTSVNAGLNYRSTFKQMQFYGETALNKSGALATVNGLMLPVTGEIGASMVYRNYQPEYNAIYGGAFAEQSGVQNEEGFYLGLEMHPIPNLTIAGYADHYYFPWLSYRKSAPANGSEYFLKADYSFSPEFETSLRFKAEKERENLTADEQDFGVKKLTDVRKGYLRYNHTYILSEYIELENRFQWAFYEKAGKKSNGFMLYQDVRYIFADFPLQLDARIALYHTDNYQTRVYAYEHDVLYAFSVPAYYGKGMRTYLLMKYEPTENLDLWLKAGQSYFADRQEVGTGLNTIAGPAKTRIRLQLRYKF